jgi:alpha-mannosidase
VQRIILYAGRDTVDFETLVRDWGHPMHRFLKVAFPTALANPRQEVRNNMPYGSLARVLDGHRADTEFVGHKWVELADTNSGAAGFTLFNREKFGYDVANDGPGGGLSDGACNILRLSLLKSGMSPLWLVPDFGGPVTDQGDFLTHYRAYPHAGDVGPAEFYRRGEAFANPLLVHFVSTHDGRLPATGRLLSFAGNDGEVLATTLKRPDRDAQDRELIVRLVEIDGRSAEAGIEDSAWSLLSAHRADILERVGGEDLAVNDNFSLALNSGAIETVRLSFGDWLATDDDGDDVGDDDADDDASPEPASDDDDEGCCG